MQIGIIGLGKMGMNLALNAKQNNHEVIAFDVDSSAVKSIESFGIKTVQSVRSLCSTLDSTRVIWLMIPAGELVDETIEVLIPNLSKGDIIIDGGNSYFKDSIRRSDKLKLAGISFLDCGTSGGREGARNGACTMVGGNPAAYEFGRQFFTDISVEGGHLYCGASGSGHFVKMIHNGIEYGMMQSIAEGFEVLQKSEFNLNLEKVAHVWNNGSVIRSWLMELTERALSKDANLDQIKGVMHSSGEGKWTLDTALERQIATPVIALSVLMRFRSLETDTFSGKVVAALRNEFGGHAVEKNN